MIIKQTSNNSDPLQDSLSTLDLTEYDTTSHTADTRGESWQTLETLCEEDQANLNESIVCQAHSSRSSIFLPQPKETQKQSREFSFRKKKKGGLAALITTKSNKKNKTKKTTQKKRKGIQQDDKKDSSKTTKGAQPHHHVFNPQMSEGERYALEFLLGEKIEIPCVSEDCVAGDDERNDLTEGEQYAYSVLLGDKKEKKFSNDKDEDANQQKNKKKKTNRRSQPSTFNPNMTENERFALQYLLGETFEPTAAAAEDVEEEWQAELTPGEEYAFAVLLGDASAQKEEEGKPQRTSSSRRRRSSTGTKRVSKMMGSLFKAFSLRSVIHGGQGGNVVPTN